MLSSLVPRAATLEDFVALNDEIAALSRAGVPLGRGLLQLRRDLPGKLGALAGEIGRRLEQGEPLEQIVARSPGLFPPVYRAVLQAGLRVGRLPAALEHISATARRTAQTRQSVGLTLLYPLAVIALAYGLLLFWLWQIVPTLVAFFDDFGPDMRPLWDGVLAARSTMLWWAPLLPLVVVLWATWFWWRSGRVAQGLELHPLLALGGVRRLLAMRRAARLGALADLLALLVEYGVSLPSALVLAAEATGDRRLIDAGTELAGQIERGEVHQSAVNDPEVSGGTSAPAANGNPHRPAAEGIERSAKPIRPHAAGLLPMLVWALASRQVEAELPSVLRRMARIYREEAARHAHWLGTTRPIFVTGLLGGMIVALFAAVHIGPFLLVLYKLIEATYQT